MSLKDRVAVVLGASAQTGSGWAIAERLAAEGAKVVVGARRVANLERLAARIGGKAVACDLACEAQIIQLVKTAVDTHGKLDVAVNCGAHMVLGSIADVPTERLRASLEVNFLGNVHFIKHAAAAMGDGGSIVIMSSYSAVQPVIPTFGYACAKAATDCLVRYAAIEHGPRGIRVNSILPGPIKSEMAAQIFAVPGMEAVFAREIPLGRIGLPEDYGDIVAWLATAPFVTGLNLPVNGGAQLTRMPRADEMPAGDTFFAK
jgi:NAD(P)-dependent dehydrogenase (short-subunit alcohol dehydrogenase family)